MHKLTAEDKDTIDGWAKQFERGLDALEKAKQLNVGDYLVLYTGPNLDEMKLQVNSYGAPVKYKVVYTTQHGIPFIKKVTKNGNPTGSIFSCMGSLDEDEYRYIDDCFEFRLDPDYADSLILQEEYDPAILHKSRQSLWKEVTKHNKNARVDTNTLGNVVEFFKATGIGDTLWTSSSGRYLVQDKQTMTRQDFKKNLKDNYTSSKGAMIVVLTVSDRKNKTHIITADFFYGKVLYKERPRSYKELKT